MPLKRQAAPPPPRGCGGGQRSRGVGTRSVLEPHTRRHCLTTASKASDGSLPARPRCEQHSGVGEADRHSLGGWRVPSAAANRLVAKEVHTAIRTATSPLFRITSTPTLLS